MTTIIVEDGTGLPDANSYASVADAEAFHDLRGTPAWVNSSDDDAKAASLVMATDYIDLTYSFAGYPVAPAQAAYSSVGFSPVDMIGYDLLAQEDGFGCGDTVGGIIIETADTPTPYQPQALANPRAGQAGLHPLVVKATIVLAAKYLAGTVDSTIAGRDVVSEQKIAGPVQISNTYRSTRTLDPFPDVSGILKPLLAGGVGCNIGRFIK